MATRERLAIESMLMIVDKERESVPFKLNESQANLDLTLTGRDIIPKARQRGITSYYLARGLVKCLGIDNTNAVIISHDTLSTQKMLDKVKYYISSMRGPKPIISISNKNEIKFPKTNSTFYIGTAGAKQFGRGDTISFLHCSEVAFWPDPKSILAGLFQAVTKNGEVAIESTGLGKGNWYHRACMRAASGEGRYRLHFYSWLDAPEYCNDISPEEQLDIMENLNKEWEEDKIVSVFGLTAGQIAWRRDKLEEMDYDLSQFHQEYPLTIDECFQASGRSIFNKVNYKVRTEWKKTEANLYTLSGHPRKDYTYVIGGDIAGGIGGRSSDKNSKSKADGDRSVAQIICIDTMEQVAEYANNKIMPDVFGSVLARLGVQYNNAYIVPENNNHGIVTIKELLGIYPNNLIYKKPSRGAYIGEEVDKLTRYGFHTSVKSKPFAIGKLRKLIIKELTVHSPLLIDELDSFIETESGTMEAEGGCFDDRVMALAMACIGLEKGAMMSEAVKYRHPIEVVNPFQLESIINELHKKSSGYPIADQVDEEIS